MNRRTIIKKHDAEKLANLAKSQGVAVSVTNTDGRIVTIMPEMPTLAKPLNSKNDAPDDLVL